MICLPGRLPCARPSRAEARARRRSAVGGEPLARRAVRELELRERDLGLRAELREIARRDLGVGQHDVRRVLVHALHAVLVVQVRARRRAGGADVADDLALPHAAAVARRLAEARHVAVQRAPALSVVDDDGLAVTVLPAGQFDAAVTRGGCIVNTARSRVVLLLSR